MRHFVQYHQPEIMGAYASEGQGFGIQTDKSVRNLIGQKIWLITSEAGRPRKYFLCESFVVSHAGENPHASYKYQASGEVGDVFEPMIRLDELPWFKAFLRQQANFSRGLSQIDDRFANLLQDSIEASDIDQLSLGQTFTRSQINQLFGGDLQSYLPHSGGKIVCGCFDPRLNRKAPHEIDIGSGEKVIKYARLLADSAGTIPVFLKRSANAWMYCGNYRAVRFSSETKDVHPGEGNRRKDAIGVLYLESIDNRFPDEISSSQTLREGAVHKVTVDAFERNPIARQQCIDHYGTSCSVCGLNFEKVYGVRGLGYIHVHHLRSLSEIREDYQIDPIADLRPICPNCHSMIHRKSPALDIDQLKTILCQEYSDAINAINSK